MWRVGVDVGGTFTDLFGWDDATERRVTAKVLTTKHDRSEGVLQAVRAAGIPFHQISHLLHGTTTATNALIERSCPDAALVTTEGFRDTIEIGRQHRVMLLLGTMLAERRLAVFLLDLADRYRDRGYSSCEYVLRMTREEIGSYLGLKLETVSRLFSRFQQEGLIQVQGRAIKLLDTAALRQLAGQHG